MKCAFCGYDFGNARPTSCPSCNAGLDGLTEGQMVTITHDLKEAERNEKLGVCFGTLVIGAAIVGAVEGWGAPLVIVLSVLGVLVWGAATAAYIKARDLRWTLNSWTGQKQATKPKAKKREIKDVDSIEAIRKLAELRDQGILTQEEFEQKKKKLL